MEFFSIFIFGSELSCPYTLAKSSKGMEDAQEQLWDPQQDYLPAKLNQLFKIQDFESNF